MIDFSQGNRISGSRGGSPIFVGKLTASPTVRGALDHPGCPARSRIRKRFHRRDLDHVFRIVVDQLEPVFGNIGGWKNVVLDVFSVECELQIRLTDSFLLLSGDSPFDRPRFVTLDNTANNPATHEIPSINS